MAENFDEKSTDSDGRVTYKNALFYYHSSTRPNFYNSLTVIEVNDAGVTSLMKLGASFLFSHVNIFYFDVC